MAIPVAMTPAASIDRMAIPTVVSAAAMRMSIGSMSSHERKASATSPTHPTSVTRSSVMSITTSPILPRYSGTSCVSSSW